MNFLSILMGIWCLISSMCYCVVLGMVLVILRGLKGRYRGSYCRHQRSVGVDSDCLIRIRFVQQQQQNRLVQQQGGCLQYYEEFDQGEPDFRAPIHGRGDDCD